MRLVFWQGDKWLKLSNFFHLPTAKAPPVSSCCRGCSSVILYHPHFPKACLRVLYGCFNSFDSTGLSPGIWWGILRFIKIKQYNTASYFLTPLIPENTHMFITAILSHHIIASKRWDSALFYSLFCSWNGDWDIEGSQELFEWRNEIQLFFRSRDTNCWDHRAF